MKTRRKIAKKESVTVGSGNVFVGGLALTGEAVLRVPHLSRRATDGAFEFRITCDQT